MRLLIFTFLFLLNLSLAAQYKEYKVAAIGFYNLENYFDTQDDPTINDDDFTPNGRNQWTEALFQEKTTRLATVIRELAELTPDGLALLGVAEIENKEVLQKLVEHPLLADRQYQIIHFDSPDRRGIDVGLSLIHISEPTRPY